MLGVLPFVEDSDLSMDGMGVTMAQYCITACSEKCSLDADKMRGKVSKSEWDTFNGA